MWFLALICVWSPWSLCSEKKIFNKSKSPPTQLWFFFHCPRRVGMELLFPWTRLELLLHQWVSPVNALELWDFGFPWCQNCFATLSHTDTWGVNESIWVVPTACRCITVIENLDDGLQKARSFTWQGCLSWIIYEASWHASKFCKSNEVLVTWVPSLQLL